MVVIKIQKSFFVWWKGFIFYFRVWLVLCSDEPILAWVDDGQFMFLPV